MNNIAANNVLFLPRKNNNTTIVNPIPPFINVVIDFFEGPKSNIPGVSNHKSYNYETLTNFSARTESDVPSTSRFLISKLKNFVRDVGDDPNQFLQKLQDLSSLASSDSSSLALLTNQAAQARKYYSKIPGQQSYTTNSIINIHNTSVNVHPSIMLPSVDSYEHTTPYLIAKCVFIILLTFAIVSLNTTVIWVLTRYRETLNLELYSYYNLSIAVADLLMGLLVTPLSIYPVYMGYWVYGNLACKFSSYLQVVIWIVVWCHFMWIGADRYLALRKPYKYENGSSRKTRYKCWIAFCWLTATLITSPHLYGYTWSRYNLDTYLCVLDWRLMTAYSLTVGVLIMVPTFCTLAFTYTRIFSQLITQYRSIRATLLARARGQSIPTNAANTLLLLAGGGRPNTTSPYNGRRKKNKNQNAASYLNNNTKYSRLSHAFADSYKRIRKSIVVPGFGLHSHSSPHHHAYENAQKHSPMNNDEINFPLIEKAPSSIKQNRQEFELQPKIPTTGSGDYVITNLKKSVSKSKLNLKNTTNPPSMPSPPIVLPMVPGGPGTSLKGKRKSDLTDFPIPEPNVSSSILLPFKLMSVGSYLLSFINIIIFVASWIPWIVLKVHTYMAHELEGLTRPTPTYTLLLNGTSYVDKDQSFNVATGGNSISNLNRYRKAVSNPNSHEGVGAYMKPPYNDMTTSHISFFQNPNHPELEFVTSWIIIANSMFKPMFYLIFDKKFRSLVCNLLLGQSSQQSAQIQNQPNVNPINNINLNMI